MIDLSAESPQAAAALQILAAPLELVEGQEFVDRTIYLDGREWLNCTFRGCRLVARLGWFKIVGVGFDETCSFETSTLLEDAHEFMSALDGVSDLAYEPGAT